MSSLTIYSLFSLLSFTAGLGWAYWLLPAGWKRFTPALAIPSALGAVTALMWWVANFDGPPVDSIIAWYWVAISIPLAVALLMPAHRRKLVALGLHRGALVPAVVSFVAASAGIITALSLRHDQPLTVSHGSCDAPDYAIGIRMLRSFTLSSREGFLGQAEVHQLGDLGNYYSFWLHHNHFSSAATGAWFASTLAQPEHRIISLLACLIFASIAPVTLPMSRKLLKLPSGWALLVSLYVAIHPYLLYAQGQVALGQLMGTLGVVVCMAVAGFLGGVARFRDSLRYLPLALLGGWLVLGGYHIMTPAVLGICGLLVLCVSLIARSWKSLFYATLTGACALGVLIIAFPDRAKGAWISLTIYGGTPFGWPISTITWSSLHGILGSSTLEPLPFAKNYLAATLLLIIAGLGAILAYCNRRKTLLPVAVAMATVGIVYFAILIRDPNDEALSSYKAYKLISIFVPAFLALIVALWRELWNHSLLGKALLVITLLASTPRMAESTGRYYEASHLATLTADDTWLQVRALESQSDGKGVNVLCVHVWDRLWTSAYLLRQKQYYGELSYWGHAPTELKGSLSLTKPIPGEPSPSVWSPEKIIGPGMRVTPMSQTLAPGERIDFSVSGNLGGYAISGIAPAKGDSSRSTASEVRLIFNPVKSGGHLLAELVAYPFADNGTFDPQRCEISLNGKRLFDMPFNGPGVARFIIDAELWNSRPVAEMVIDLPDARSSGAANVGDRGLALRWLSIKLLEPNTPLPP